MGSASVITRICCEAVRSAILATAWLLVAVGDDKKKVKEMEGNGRYHVTRRYLSAICRADSDTPWPIPIKFGMLVASTRDVINMSNFCNKIFRGFRSTGGQNPRFSIDFASHRYVLP